MLFRERKGKRGSEEREVAFGIAHREDDTVRSFKTSKAIVLSWLCIHVCTYISSSTKNLTATGFRSLNRFVSM